MHVRKLLRPFLFLVTASAILLISDWQNRKDSKNRAQKVKIALFRFNANPVQEETEKGVLKVLEGLRAFRDGKIEIRRFSAEGDMPTANMIASNIVSEKFDYVVSISTPGLQVMANANQEGRVKHVFCAVTDPVASGVGITGSAADQHPPFMAGIGTFQPVESVFRMARQMNPQLKKVGVVWCTSETCSEACVKKARAICDELHIELIEMSVETVSQVYEAALAVSLKGVEALWIGGDNVVESAIEMYIGAASKNHIPVFTNNPNHTFSGAMISLGANYYEVGLTAGMMLDSVLKGFPMSHIEINNVVPEKLFLNDSVRKLMNKNWLLPNELKVRADSIIE